MLQFERAGNPKEPYGPKSQVAYADPGYQKDGKARYPINTVEHAKAAWSYVNQASNAGKYSSEHLASIKGRIKAALKKFGVQVSTDAARLAEWLESTRWDNGLPVEETTRNVPTPSDLFAPRPFSRSDPLEDISIRAGGD